MQTGNPKLPSDDAQPCRLEHSGMKRWTSQELFAGTRELVILHAGSEYRLRLTSQGKLVLTK